jgi:hypothetical protein
MRIETRAFLIVMLVITALCFFAMGKQLTLRIIGM